MSLLERMINALEAKYFLTEANQDYINFENWCNDKELYNRFVNLRNKKKIPAPFNDFGYWMSKKKPKTKEDLIKYLDDLENYKSKSKLRQDDMATRKAEAEYEEIYKGNGWRIIKINNQAAAVYYGVGTKWCIAGNYYELKDNMTPEEIEAAKEKGKRMGKDFFKQYEEQGVRGYYFLISDKNDKWCYMDWGSIKEMDISEIFCDSHDHRYRSADLDKVFEHIPIDIIFKLPHMKEYIDKLEEREDKYQQIKHTIKNGAFTYHNNIDKETLLSLKNHVTKIIVSRDVEELPAFIFQGFSQVDEITFEKPSKVQTIGEGALAITKIKSIEIPRSVKKLESGALGGIGVLEKITFEKGSHLEDIDDYALAYNSFTEIIIPKSVKTIGTYAFNDWKLSKVTFEPGSQLKTIKKSAFINNQVKELTLPETVSFIDCSIIDSAYSTIRRLNIEGKRRPEIFIDKNKADGSTIINWIDEGIEETISEMISRKESYHKYSNTHRILTEDQSELIYEGGSWKIYKVGDQEAAHRLGRGSKWCISGKNGYDGPTFYDSHMKVGVKCYYILISKNDKWLYFDYGNLEEQQKRHVFYDKADNRYTLFNIKPVLKAIPEEVLKKLPFLDKINFDVLVKNQEQAEKMLREDRTFIVTPKTTVAQVQSLPDDIKKVIVKKETKEIPDRMFRDIPALRCLEFEKGSNCERIGRESFRINNLQEIIIPKSVKSIDYRAFATNAISKITFEEGSQLQTIGAQAFEDCEILSEITIPAGVTSIGRDCFSICPKLKTIKVKGKYRPDMFKDCGIEQSAEVKYGTNGVKIEWLDDIKNEIEEELLSKYIYIRREKYKK